MLKIPPDYTFVVQIVLFLVLWQILRRMWFEPALRIMRERVRRSEGAIAEARAIQADVERLRAEHTTKLDAARSEAAQEMREMLQRAEAEQKRMLLEAHEDAHRTLSEMRVRIAEEVTVARAALREQARAIARDAVRVILGRAV